MKAKFLILCLPLLGGCGGFVELGPVDHDQGEPSSSTSVEFEHTLIQFALATRHVRALLGRANPLLDVG